MLISIFLNMFKNLENYSSSFAFGSLEGMELEDCKP